MPGDNDDRYWPENWTLDDTVLRGAPPPGAYKYFALRPERIYSESTVTEMHAELAAERDRLQEALTAAEQRLASPDETRTGEITELLEGVVRLEAERDAARDLARAERAIHLEHYEHLSDERDRLNQALTAAQSLIGRLWCNDGPQDSTLATLAEWLDAIPAEEAAQLDAEVDVFADVAEWRSTEARLREAGYGVTCYEPPTRSAGSTEGPTPVEPGGAE